MKALASIVIGLTLIAACANEPAKTTRSIESSTSPAPSKSASAPEVVVEKAAPDVTVVEKTNVVKSVVAAPSPQPRSLASNPQVPAPESAKLQPQASLTRVDPSLVCMMNNHFMGKAQIPVVVEGKTYFGCCEMCKGKLAKDPSSRTAKDPVSGAAVDKSLAVIAKDESGDVMYFENEKNLEQYAAR